MLDVRSVRRCYGDVKAVDNVSFTIDRGEIVGLLGHNGAGKTTIMKMLSGYLEPDSGTITLDGTGTVDDSAVLQRSLGYLPESLPLYPELSVAEYLDYSADLKGLRKTDKHSEIRRVIAATELSSKLLAPIATLSRGFKQRAGVAQAILGQPNILILDEPTNGLDPAQTEQMRQLIRALSQSATILLSTHIMQEVEAICDRALIIRRGQLVVDERLADLTHGDRLRLTTTIDERRVSELLAGLPDVQSIELCADTLPAPALPVDVAIDKRDLSIRIRPDSNASSVIAEITKILVNAAIPVMGIRTDSRDLQSLFMQVNATSEDVASADGSLGGLGNAA